MTTTTNNSSNNPTSTTSISPTTTTATPTASPIAPPIESTSAIPSVANNPSVSPTTTGATTTPPPATNNIEHCIIPNFILHNVLVPLKIDVTYKGARYVDTFCWSLYSPAISPEELAMRTCHDLNFPIGFHQKISLEIIEQLQAYHILIESIKSFAPCIPNWNQKIRQVQVITIGIRHGPLDYSDKIEWDPINTNITPEEFAATTCADLGLPSEVEPAIAHKIREALFRWLLNILQNPNATETNIQTEFKVPETKVSLVPPNQAVDMVTNLWKRARPNSMEEIAAVPQPQMPVERESNATIWLQSSAPKNQPTPNTATPSSTTTVGNTSTAK